jgi:hypothetical protein
LDVVGMQLFGLLASAEHQAASFASRAGAGEDFGTIRSTESTDRSRPPAAIGAHLIAR